MALPLTPLSPLEEGYKTLGRDRAKLAKTNYPIYKGNMTSPKSVLTQKAEDLTQKYAKGPAPYAGKIQTAMGRNTQGFAPGEIQGLLGSLGNNQRQFSGNLLDVLQNNFKNSYNPNVAGFTQGTNADTDRGVNEAAGRFGNIESAATNLEGARNRQIIDALQKLQTQKTERRGAFVNTLSKSGQQEQARNNLELAAQRGQFDKQVNDPQRKMGLLGNILEKNAPNVQGDNIHPDLEQASNAEITQGLKAYNTPFSPYTGELVAPLPPEIMASNNVLAAMNPALKDSYSAQKKAAIAALMNNPNIGSRALAAVPGRTQGETTALEQDARDTYNKDLGRLNNKYIRLGQYNSPSHITSAEDRAKEISKLVGGHRNALTQGSLVEQLGLQNNADINSIGNLNQMGNQGQQEYSNLFSNMNNLNNLGANKWKNQQNENQELYKNYQSESNWEWPQGKGIGAAGMGNIGGAQNANANAIGGGNNLVAPNQMDIGFNNLGNQNTAYNQAAPAPTVPTPTINNAASAQAALQKQLQAQQAQAQMLKAKKLATNAPKPESFQFPAGWNRIRKPAMNAPKPAAPALQSVHVPGVHTAYYYM